MKKKLFLTLVVVLVSTFLFQVNAEASQCVLRTVTPDDISATWIPGAETLNIFANGYAKCPNPAQSRIIPGPAIPEPPDSFYVQVCEGMCDVIAPYSVIGHFEGYKSNPKEITIITPEGNKKIKVSTILDDIEKGTKIPKCLTEKLPPNEAVGIAVGNYDISLAYANAVKQLKKRYKRLNVVVEQIGTIKGNTVQFYTYVKVKQQD